MVFPNRFWQQFTLKGTKLANRPTTSWDAAPQADATHLVVRTLPNVQGVTFEYGTAIPPLSVAGYRMVNDDLIVIGCTPERSAQATPAVMDIRTLALFTATPAGLVLQHSIYTSGDAPTLHYLPGSNALTGVAQSHNPIVIAKSAITGSPVGVALAAAFFATCDKNQLQVPSISTNPADRVSRNGSVTTNTLQMFAVWASAAIRNGIKPDATAIGTTNNRTSDQLGW